MPENSKRKKSTMRGHEIGVGSTYYEGKEILGAKPIVAPWEKRFPETESFGHPEAPGLGVWEEQVVGETGGIEEPGGTTGDLTD